MTNASGSDTGTEYDRRFHLLIESIEDYAIYMLDPGGHVVTWNRGAELNKGYSRDEILGKHFDMFFCPEDVEAGVPYQELHIAAETGRVAGEGWRLHKDGRRFWAGFTLTAMRDSEDNLLGFAKVTKDLTDRKRFDDSMIQMGAALQEERDRLREERDRFHAAAESSLDALYICRATRDADGEIDDFIFTYLNRNVEKMVAIPRHKLLGQRMCAMLPVNRTSGLFDQYKRVVLTGEPFVREFPIDDRNVASSWVRAQAVKLRDGVAITVSDITRQKALESRMLYMAQHDPLTGLSNRSVMEDRVGQAIKLAKRSGSRVGLLTIDIDGFKQINDILGHPVGDAVLATIANRLQASVRESDTVIRIGGDEFVVIAQDHAYPHGIGILAQKLLDCVRAPMFVDGNNLLITCSIGTAVYPDDGATCKDMLSRSDAAMYYSKRHGRDCVTPAEAHTEIA